MKNEIQTISQKHLLLNQHLKNQIYLRKQQKILTIINFRHSQIRQIEFEQLADLLLK